jgi:hypothetical protein
VRPQRAEVLHVLRNPALNLWRRRHKTLVDSQTPRGKTARRDDEGGIGACLQTARNALIYRGNEIRELIIDPGDWFQVGQTTITAGVPAVRRRRIKAS